MNALDKQSGEIKALASRERSLLATPQKWGLLPTKWFWNKPSNWKHLIPLIVSACAVLLPLMVLFFKLVGGIHYPYLFLFVLVGGSEMGLGLLERHVRKKARLRIEEREATLSLPNSDLPS